MPKITLIEHNGETHRIDANDGCTLMEAATRSSVPGIDADCGGACACATCHVYVANDWIDAVGQRSDMEHSILVFAKGLQPTSRLACQIFLTPELDGLVAFVPEHQH